MKLLNKNLEITSDIVLVGKIIGQHGIKGVLKVYSFTESLKVYDLFDELLIKLPGSHKLLRKKLLWYKLFKKNIYLKLNGIIDRDTAKSMLGFHIYVKKCLLPPLEEDTYFWSDLIGISVKSNCGRELGYLDAIISTGSNDVYLIKQNYNDVNSEILIPAIKSVVLSVDLVDKIMVVDLPEGLE